MQIQGLQRHSKTIMKTDTQLQLGVIAELKWQPSVNAAQIGVEVKDGERAAQRVPGVKARAVAY